MSHKARRKIFLTAYDSHSDEVFAFCLKHTRDRDVALDVLQITFMRTWEYLDRGHDIGHVRGFLFRVARNAIIDWSRKPNSVSLDVLHETGAFQPEDERALEKLETSLEQEHVQAVVSQLPNRKHREILQRRFLDQQPVDQIAKELSLTKNAVSVRIHRSVHYFKDYIKRHYG
jgi:RNA polymerase sigma factor (sigma-70 family)